MIAIIANGMTKKSAIQNEGGTTRTQNVARRSRRGQKRRELPVAALLNRRPGSLLADVGAVMRERGEQSLRRLHVHPHFGPRIALFSGQVLGEARAIEH